MGQALALLHPTEGLVFIAAAPVRPHHPLVIPGDYLLDLLVAVPGPHLVVQGVSGGHGPRPQPVSGSAVLVRGQIRMFPANFAATASAAIDPHPVLSCSGPRHGAQLGNIGQVYPFLSQLPTTPGAALQGHWYVHWRFGDFLRAWCLAKGEGAFTRLAAGAPGLPGTGPFGEGGGLALGAPLELVIFSR